MTEKETLKPDLLLQTLSVHTGVTLPAYRLHRLRLLTEVNGRAVNQMNYYTRMDNADVNYLRSLKEMQQL